MIIHWGVLDCPNFGCFVSSRCQHFHCIAMRNSIKVGVNCHKIRKIKHTPGMSCLSILKHNSFDKHVRVIEYIPKVGRCHFLFIDHFKFESWKVQT